MKKLKYIYTLITVVLLSTVIYSCDDSSMFITEEVDTAESSSNGETVKTTFTVGISAPNVSGDLDVETRAGVDNANIEYAKPENGGRFQNLIVVLTDHNDKIYGVECREYNDGVGRKDEEVIFSDIEVPTADVNNKDYKVYAFGNVCTEHYNAFKGDTASAHESIKGDLSNRKTISDLTIYANCITSNISVSDPYQINFEQGKTYNVGDSSVSSTGMPVNNMVSATVKKGNTQFNVAMKRVCARLQVTFRNFTGTYIDYETSTNKENNVYVDKFEIKNVLANKANYFCNNTTSLTGVTSSNFDILQALGGSKTNDHIINKVENGKDLVVSMYVFENNKGGYQYDLKVDRGKSLGLNTTTIDPENAYVIWNNDSDVTNPSSISYRDGVIKVSRKQDSYDKIPFSDQVFWQFVEPSTTHKTNVFALRHYQIDLISDKHVESNVYLSRLSDSDIDWGFLGAFYNYKHIIPSPASQLSDAQYVQFKQESSTSNKFTMNLLNGNNVNREYWDKVVLSERHVMLTLCNNSHDNQDKNQLATQRTSFWNGNKLGNYDWTLYAKYIIKNNQQFKDNDGTISKIDRNHSYELDFSVMPNYETKQELLVNCVRKQNEVNWSEVQK